MGDHAGTIGVFLFRGVEYIVTSQRINQGRTLIVEVEDRASSDQWRGSFDAPYIEEMTHKTGNFKQFSIFISMLETAVSKSSEAVTLDLLTYSDLEALRCRKTGSVGSKHIPPARNAVLLGSKKYLILTYTVEFDRIHYPLPLPYVGKPDPTALQNTVRQLRQEIKYLQEQSSKEYKAKEIEKLKKERDQALSEKEELAAEFLLFRRELQTTKEGTAVKEIRSLKTIIKHLEEDLMNERNKHQKSSSKRSQAYRNLLDEVEELRASERNLKVRVKSLTNELALLSRQGRLNTSGSSARHRSTSRDNSLNNSKFSSNSRQTRDQSYENRSNPHNRGRPLSRERYLEKTTSRSYDGLSRLSRDRSGSRERPGSINRRNSHEGSVGRLRGSSTERGRSTERSMSVGYRSRTPSPAISVSSAGARQPRFDPTAFVKERDRKKREADLRRRRRQKSAMNGSLERNSLGSPAGSDRIPIGRARKSSASSLRSRTSSVESLTETEMASDASDGRKLNSVLKTRRTYRTRNIPSSPDTSFSRLSSGNSASKNKKILASTPEKKRTKSYKKTWTKENEEPSDACESDFYDRSKEISDIDARLSRLQKFMKSNLPV